MDDLIAATPGKLGFGLMRLPRKFGRTDVKQVSQMVDLFLESGFTYFDTAFVYVGSEQTIGKALVKRHPRESFTLASKVYAPLAPTKSAAHKQFETTLKRTGAGYIDYYLLHTLTNGNYQMYDRLDLWNWAQKKKEEGLIKHVGFSFHAGPILLDQILTAHPEVEFVQLQLNYADWEDKAIASRANYEVARKHGKPIVVMEPVKGGKLAKPPREAAELLKAANPDASLASWAIRFVASLEGILSVLSGMSNLEQMRDNVSYMRDFKPLSDEERAVLREVQQIMHDSPIIQCTNCRYCVDGCPQKIAIPEVFEAMNLRLGNGQIEESKVAYEQAVRGGGKASECIECGQCNEVCTQQIDVMARLKDVAAALE
ncbi:MAG: aldo/keto reductase [Coriobacteriales bacterium]|jgi:predicted aldo/keto reductase-like oxidoreductase